MYDHVDLFSGLGCWALAARANGLRTVAFCEREEWLAAGLERTWGVPCHRDIKTFPAKDYAGRVWLLTGSPPCQPASLAGKRRGKADDRWLWGETIGVCEVIQPTWFIFENPPGLDGVGLDGIISDLERIGYEVATLRIPACAVDSPQLRDRFWIVGNAKQDGRNRRCDERDPGGMGTATTVKESTEPKPGGSANTSSDPTQGGAVADSELTKLQKAQAGWTDRENGTSSTRPTQSGVVADAGRGTHSRPIQREGELTAGVEAEPCPKDGVVADARRERETTPNEQFRGEEGTCDVDRESPEGCALADGAAQRTCGKVQPCGSNEPHKEHGLSWKPGGSPWSDYEWIPFNGAVYRAPVGLYELAYESTVVIPKKFRSKIISALGNAIVWPVAAEIIRAILKSELDRKSQPH